MSKMSVVNALLSKEMDALKINGDDDDSFMVAKEFLFSLFFFGKNDHCYLLHY
jgi:hypothetical protein